MYVRLAGFSLAFAMLLSSGAVNSLDDRQYASGIQFGAAAYASDNGRIGSLSGKNDRYVGLLLEHMDFSDRDLRGTNFSLSQLVSVDFAGAMLSGSDFSSSVFKKVDFSGANLEVTSFRGARLAGVDFTGANLQGACFVDAELSDVDFTGADLSGAVMPDSQRKSVNFDDAVVKDTIWNGHGQCPRGNPKFAEVDSTFR